MVYNELFTDDRMFTDDGIIKKTKTNQKNPTELLLFKFLFIIIVVVQNCRNVLKR